MMMMMMIDDEPSSLHNNFNCSKKQACYLQEIVSASTSQLFRQLQHIVQIYKISELNVNLDLLLLILKTRVGYRSISANSDLCYFMFNMHANSTLSQQQGHTVDAMHCGPLSWEAEQDAEKKQKNKHWLITLVRRLIFVLSCK